MSKSTESKKRLKWWHVALIAAGGVIVALWGIGTIAGAMGYEPTVEAQEQPKAETPKPKPEQPKTEAPKQENPKSEKPKPEKPETPKRETPEQDRAEILTRDINTMLETAGDEAHLLHMSRITEITDSSAHIRIKYQDTIATKDDAVNIVREIYGFTASEAFTDNATTTVVITSADGRDWNVWVDLQDGVATYRTGL